ncbi:MAG: hypothetical protein GY764_11820 [Halieaceae bacterium]|nr:hypothetical protein [Halieaceae bacterium]
MYTTTIQPQEPYRDIDNVYRSLYPNDKPRLIDHGVELLLSDTLQVRTILIENGDHLLGVYRGNLEIARFRSWAVSALMARGEPVAAFVTDSVGDKLFRVDVVLNRSVNREERIPLLAPAMETGGISAQLAPVRGEYRAVAAGWHPVRGLPDHHYFPERFSKPTFNADLPSPYDTAPRLSIPRGLHPIRAAQNRLWNPTPWKDLGPAVTTMTQYGGDFAYLPFGYDHGLSQLLLRGERIEASVVGAGSSMPGEVLINLLLVA